MGTERTLPLVGVPTRQFVLEVLPGFVVGGALALSLSGLRIVLDDAGLPAIAILALAALAGSAISAALLRTLFAETWVDLVSIARRVASDRSSAQAV